MRDFVGASEGIVCKQGRAAQTVARFRQTAASVIEEECSDATGVSALRQVAGCVVGERRHLAARIRRGQQLPARIVSKGSRVVQRVGARE